MHPTMKSCKGNAKISEPTIQLCRKEKAKKIDGMDNFFIKYSILMLSSQHMRKVCNRLTAVFLIYQFHLVPNPVESDRILSVTLGTNTNYTPISQLSKITTVQEELNMGA